MWAEQSPTRSDPEGSSRNEFASGHVGLSPVPLRAPPRRAGGPGAMTAGPEWGHGAE